MIVIQMEEIITKHKEIIYQFEREEFIKKYRSKEKDTVLCCDLCNENMDNIINIYYVGDLKEPDLAIEEIGDDLVMDSGAYSICFDCFKKVDENGFLKTKLEIVKSYLKKKGLQDEVDIDVNGSIITLRKK